MRQWGIVPFLVATAACLALSPSCRAGAIAGAIFSLGPAQQSGSIVSFDVRLTYTDTSPFHMVYLGIDVTIAHGSNTDPKLAPDTGSGPDYSAFNFIPAGLIAGWNVIPSPPGEWTFDVEGGVGTPIEPPQTGLLVGTLKYNLSVFNITPSASLLVSIKGFDTVIGHEDPTTAESFDFIDPTFAPGDQPLLNPNGGGGGGGTAVPEPSSAALFALLTAAGFAARRRPRRPGTAG
jgi:hypothetical protein